MEASSIENGRNDGNSRARSLEKGVVVNEVGGGEEEDEETLKTRILEHPLYGLLIETHMECLKVGLGETEEADSINAAKQTNLELQTDPSSSELDLFMEAYCVTLGKLKEAMEEPLQETASFIKATYERLEELSDNHPNPPRPSSK